jgi:hypothetical protein
MSRGGTLQVLVVCLGLLHFQIASGETINPIASVSNTPDTSIAMPRQVAFSGVLPNVNGSADVRGIVFSVFAEQAGGTALWLETQSVPVSESGSYTVLLGSQTRDGLPQSMFSSAKARWLDVSYTAEDGSQVAQPRVLLVSVPYAMKSGDADTVGGLPASAFIRAPQGGSTSSNADGTFVNTAAISGTGTTNFLSKWTDGPNGVLGDSAVSESGGNVSVSGNLQFTAPVSAITQTVQSGILNFVAGGTPGTDPRFLMFGSAHATNANQSYWDSDLIAFRSTASVERARVDSNGLSVSTNLRFTAPTASITQTVQNGILNFVAGGTPGTDPRFLMFGSAHATNANQSFWDSDTIAFRSTAGTERMRVAPNGNIGVGTTSPGVKLEVAGNIKSSSGGFVFPDATTQLTAASSNVNIRGINFLAGCDSCTVLVDTDDQQDFYVNQIGSITIQSITCFADGGSPTIDIRRDNVGGGTNSTVISGATMTCAQATGSGGGTTVSGVSLTNNALALNDRLDFVINSAGGVAKRITLVVKALVN